MKQLAAPNDVSSVVHVMPRNPAFCHWNAQKSREPGVEKAFVSAYIRCYIMTVHDALPAARIRTGGRGPGICAAGSPPAPQSVLLILQSHLEMIRRQVIVSQAEMARQPSRAPAELQGDNLPAGRYSAR